VVDSLAVAAQALVARARGSGDPGLARTVADRLLAWGLTIGLLLGFLFLLLAPILPRAFTDEPEVMRALRGIYGFVVAMQPLNALVFVWDGIFLGAEAFRFVAIQMTVSAACAAIVLLLVLPAGWGLAGVWWGIVTLMGVRAVTLASMYWTRPLSA
jgi:MATE family multidrug resistance protein